MKTLRSTLGLFTLFVIFSATGYASRTVSSHCDSRGRIAGNYHTSCYAWVSGDGTIPVSGTNVHNDTARLKYIFDDATRTSEFGKIVFDEAAYYINDSIPLKSYRTVIGTGRASISDPTNTGYPTSRIIQMGDSKPIFTIGGSINDVAVRDIALVAGPGTSGTIGIRAQNGTTAADSYQSTNFEVTNVSFTGFYKGLYVNAQAYSPQNSSTGEGYEGYWRFENSKLDHLRFESCNIGVHYNSNNSGLSMKNILFYVGQGDELPTDTMTGEPLPINSSNIGGLKMGVYLQRVGYATLDMLIADGPYQATYTGAASAFVYVGQHSNLNIQSSIEEGFKNSIYVYGGDINSPVTITNNSIQSLLTVRNATVVSTGNQFTRQASSTAAVAKAIQYSTVYSLGDRFCFDVGSAICTESNKEEYETDAGSQVVFSASKYRNTLFNLRIGKTPYYYDIARNPNTGLLDFSASQGSGYAGYNFTTLGGAVKINYDGSVTYGSKSYTDLVNFANLTYVPANGTVIYCSNCQKSTPCASGGSGALAKRINGSWDCD